MTKANSKIYKPKLYNEAISNPIHGYYQKKAIKKELQNLESHLTQEYKKLPLKKKLIELKWVFKVKYHPNR